MLFNYKAVTPDGRLLRGRLEATGALDLETRLKRLDLDLVSSRPARHRTRFGPRRVSRRELINFCFHLEQLGRAGIPILESLSDLRDGVEGVHFRNVVAGLVEGIAGGQPLSQAMAAHPEAFSPVMTSLVQAGETAGQLPDTLADLAATLKWEDEVAAHAARLLLYPALVSLVVVATTVFLMLYLVPQLKQFVLAMGQPLPLQTRALFFTADLLGRYGHLFLLLLLASASAAAILLRTNPLFRLWVDGAKLRIPVIGGILKKIILSRLAGTFAMLYAAGIPVLTSVRTSQDVVGNRLLRQALEGVEAAIQEGRSLTAAFLATGLFPPLVVRMLAVGEHTGNLDQALRNVAYFYSRDVREAVERVETLIEPLLTLGLGGLLGWIILSVIGPIYDLVSRIAL